jgi:Mycothiol maleylpyruvate isomerase N-terminal domain
MVIDLFPQERKQLLKLFSELEAEDWEKPTICPGWTVKDIGLHLFEVLGAPNPDQVLSIFTSSFTDAGR